MDETTSTPTPSFSIENIPNENIIPVVQLSDDDLVTDLTTTTELPIDDPIDTGQHTHN